jgi:hypothetical protein
LRKETNSSHLPYEVIEAFNRNISDYMNEIELILSSSDSATQSSIDAMIDLLSQSKNLLSSSSSILSTYDIDHTLSKISEYEKKVQDKINAGKKKKFSFKTGKKTAKAPITTSPTPEQLQSSTSNQKTPSDAILDEVVDPKRSISNLNGHTVIIDSNQLKVEGSDQEFGDFTLYKLTNCQIRITGLTTALRLSRLEDCTVISAPVNGSIFVQHCKNLVLHSASRQIRIHDTTNSSFLIYTQSRPTIETCSGLKFGPYDVSHDSMESWLNQCEFVLERNEWLNVQDFNWLLRANSPNWSPIPESDRSITPL